MSEDLSEAEVGTESRSVLPGPGPVAGRRRGRRRGNGCLPVLIVLAILGGLGYVGIFGASAGGVGFKGVIPILQDRLADPEDFAGPGEGEVLFEVASGDSISTMADNLAEQGVVASPEAFSAAASEAAAINIQPGFYSLRSEMSAADAVEILDEPDNIISDPVTIPEGLRVTQVVDALVEQTDFRRAQFNRVLDSPSALGLPDYAGGNAEGYLFPATYPFGPDATPRTMLRAMVDRWRQAADEAGLVEGARELGYTPHEIMTVASLVESEAVGDDLPRVARVIYNRLGPDNDQTNGRLQIDATVIYALGFNPGTALTAEELAVDSPYNTRVNPGLPPGPIEAPGDAAIEAALNPAEGDWFYYVTVDLDTGETKFAETLPEFERYVEEYRAYCETSDRCRN